MFHQRGFSRSELNMCLAFTSLSLSLSLVLSFLTWPFHDANCTSEKKSTFGGEIFVANTLIISIKLLVPLALHVFLLPVSLTSFLVSLLMKFPVIFFSWILVKEGEDSRGRLSLVRLPFGHNQCLKLFYGWKLLSLYCSWRTWFCCIPLNFCNGTCIRPYLKSWTDPNGLWPLSTTTNLGQGAFW